MEPSTAHSIKEENLYFDEYMKDMVVIANDPPQPPPKITNIARKSLDTLLREDHHVIPAPQSENEKKNIKPRKLLSLVRPPENYEEEISQCIFMFLRDYWEGNHDVPLPTPYNYAKQLFLKSARIALPIVVKQFCYHEPFNITETQKKMFCRIIKGLRDFVTDLSGSYEEIRNRNLEFAKIIEDLHSQNDGNAFVGFFKSIGRKLSIQNNKGTEEEELKNPTEKTKKILSFFHNMSVDKMPVNVKSFFDNLRKKNYDPAVYLENFEENSHLDYFERVLKSRDVKILFPLQNKPEENRENQKKTLKLFLEFCMKKFPDAIPQEVSELSDELIDTVLDMMDQLISPYSLALMIERILQDDAKLKIPKDEKKRLRDYDASDNNFSFFVGDLIYQLAEKGVNLGDPEGISKVGIWGFMKYFKSQKTDVGIKVQQILNSITNSTCTIMPFRLMRMIFWKQSAGVIQPSFVGCYKVSTQKKVEVQNRVEKLLENKLLDKIKTEINPYIPAPAAIAVNNVETLASSVQKFCNNISTVMFSVTQQKRIMDILIYHYILSEIMSEK